MSYWVDKSGVPAELGGDGQLLYDELSRRGLSLPGEPNSFDQHPVSLPLLSPITGSWRNIVRVVDASAHVRACLTGFQQTRYPSR